MLTYSDAKADAIKRLHALKRQNHVIIDSQIDWLADTAALKYRLKSKNRMKLRDELKAYRNADSPFS